MPQIAKPAIERGCIVRELKRQQVSFLRLFLKRSIAAQLLNDYSHGYKHIKLVSRFMKILKFGWEFLPHISNGLGTAGHEATAKVNFSILAAVKHRMDSYDNLSATWKGNLQNEIKTINWVTTSKKIKNFYEPINTKYFTET